MSLRLQGIRKRWGPGPWVLDGLDLEVQPGEAVGLLGDNGAGKSTALGIAAGLVHPDAGEATVRGRPVREPESRRALGVVPESTPLPSHARVARFVARMAELSGGGDVEACLAATGLSAHREARVSHLSKGMRRRVLWAIALVHSPVALLLDEPFTALDAASREAMTALVRARLAEGAAVLVTSHREEDLRALDARPVHLRDGRIA